MNEYGQFDIFDYISEPVTIKKPIRLIELFAGYGSQAMALKRIGAKFEHYRVVEFDKYAIASYNAVHGTDFPTMDITKVHAEDLNICDTETFTYLLTHFLVRIYQLPESKPECLREVAQEVVCCGKLKEY
jgi:DNA (cytosine-5)-methyltransferase 1